MPEHVQLRASQLKVVCDEILGKNSFATGIPSSWAGIVVWFFVPEMGLQSPKVPPLHDTMAVTNRAVSAPVPSPFVGIAGRSFLRLCIWLDEFSAWQARRRTQPREELWWLRQRNFHLPFKVSFRVGGTACAIAAALAALLFHRSSSQTALPFAFLAIIIAVAILFGRLAGVIGTAVAGLIFASVLFDPSPSLAIGDPVAKAHLIWMLVIGVVVSDVIGRRRVAAVPGVLTTRKSGQS